MSIAEFDLPQYPNFMKSVKEFNKVFSKRHYKNFRYKFRLVDDAHHSGTKAEAYTRAMKFIFEPILKRSESIKDDIFLKKMSIFFLQTIQD